MLIQTPYPLQLVPRDQDLFWRNGHGFLNGGSINFGWDWIQTLSGVFGNFSHTRTLPTRKQPAWNCDLRMNMRDSIMRNRHSGPGAETNFRGYGHCSDHVGETLRVAAVT